ncbi:MAG: hypothetical protein JWR50_2963, partial [Mucilaginibacter sp.]|nr:hypothetical protein [Mucilaginibacter sp.]
RLLIAEAATTSKHKTDGIRIYFAKKSINDPETSLLLVSTIDSASTQYTHHDYYGHSNGFLFDPQQTDLSIKATDSLNNLGAVLYRPCPACPGIDTTCISVNTAGAILRSYAEKMVKNFDGSNMNTDAVWFPIGLFKSMSDEASFNGIRVYLATYPDDLYLNKGRNTFVLTTVNTTGKDYFYCDSNLKSFLKIHNTIVKYKGPPKNNGSLCPINCN